VDEIAQDSNKFKRILLARNTPVALVVGAAGFFGSHLVDRLLAKGIQVVGVDDLTYGKKNNLSEASENKNFHLIIEQAQDLSLDLDRLDYIFIASSKGIHLQKILELFKQKACRLLFLSSIDLYGEEVTAELKWLKKAEAEVARFAREHNLNARILRIGSLFGPRMNFNKADPIARLIHSSLTGDLQKELSLDFSSRALYIDDGVELAIKCIFAGATAQKIFDGVLPTPIKVAEIKQILLDPIWHENRKFKPQELPPWPTPNLDKTIKFLHWHPKENLVESLRKTLSYFKDNEINLEDLEEVDSGKSEAAEDQEWKIKKAGELEGLKEGNSQQSTVSRHEMKKSQGEGKFKFQSIYSRVMLVIALAVIAYGLIWPALELGWGVLTFRYQLTEGINSLGKGEFDKSLFSVEQAQNGVVVANAIFSSLDPIRKTNILSAQFELGDNLSTLATLSVDSAKSTILGIQQLYLAVRSVTGELTDDPTNYFDQAKVYLASSDEDLSKAFAILGSSDFKSSIPGVLKGRVSSLQDKLKAYSVLVQKARALSVLLPEAIGKGHRNYLVLLQNNNELRPGGGFIGSFANVSFEGGKLKKMEVNDTYAIDGQLKLHVEPPKEIKQYLDQKDYFLRDSNWEPDFPTSARQAEWFYNQETGQRVEGVIALDISAVSDFLSVLGPLDLPDYNVKINANNLFQEAITHSEVGFFPGSQAKKSFLTALTQGLFNQLFFLPNQNWPGVVSSLAKSLQQKHVSVYLDDPGLFSYLVSQDWAAVMPRPATGQTKQTLDFLAPVEANLGANKANYYLDRSLGLETTIGKEGEVSQRLRISYTNRSPSSAFPAGKYKNSMRVYLPTGAKLVRGLWGEKDITGSIESFADYGRLGLSFLLELAPKEQKILVLDYHLPANLQFVNGKASYRLDVVKQAGTLKDPFTWKITYPLNMKLLSNNNGVIAPQEQTIQTDLSENRSFELQFTK